MNAIQGAFYTPQALQDRYTRSLSAGGLANDLSAVEKQWLQRAVQAQPEGRPVQAHNLFVSRHQCRPVLWAGALLLRENNTAHSTVFVFTPTGRLERFASESALRQVLEQRLDDVLQQVELLRFMPVDVRPLLQQTGELTLQTQALPAPVMQHVSQGVSDYLIRCREETLASLVNVPTLRSVLDERLRSALEVEFPGRQIDPHRIGVRISKPAQAPAQVAQVITTTLSSMALDFYCKGQLPVYESREYLDFPVDSDAPGSVEERLVRVLLQATRDLAAHMKAELEAYWQAAPGALPSPQDYCIARLGDLFYHQVLQARHDGLVTQEEFDHLQLLGAGVDRTARMQAAQLSVFDLDEGEVPMSGLLCAFYPGRNSPVFSFGGAQGLIRHDNRAHLKTWVLSRLRDAALFESIAPYFAADQHEFVTGMTEPRLSVENLSTDAFSACVQSIRERQSSDFNFLLSQFRAGQVVLAGVDHALDVRELVDHELLEFNSQRRWSSRFVPQAYGLKSAGGGIGDQAGELNLKLAKLQAQRDELLRDWPTPRSFAQSRLATVLARSGHGQLDIPNVVVQTFAQEAQRQGGTPVRSMSLVDALLARVTGDRPLAGNPALVQTVVRSIPSGELKSLRSLAGTKVMTLLDLAAADFSRLFTLHLRAYFMAPYSPQAPDALILRLANLRMALLRADLRLMRLDNTLGPLDSAVIAHVLVHPVSHQRPALDQFVPDVHAITLSFNGALGSLTVVNCLLFTERGGLESDNAGRAIVWTPAVGFEDFESVDQCMEYLEARLLDKARRWELLAHVNAAEQSRICIYLDGTRNWKSAGQNRWFYFERIEQDFTVHVQTAAVHKVLADAEVVCRSAVDTPYSPQAFENRAQSLLVEGHAGVMLERLLEAAHLRMFKATLPDWLKSASVDDQLYYAHLLQRYQLGGQPHQSYLHGIPEMTAFARILLILRLETDFTRQVLDPDAIEVVIDTYLAAPVAAGNIPSFLPAATTRTLYTLTQYALSGFAHLNADAVSVRGRNGVVLPQGLTADYVRQTARRLDIGRHYRALLQARLGQDSEEADGRRQKFAEHLALQVLEQTFREKLIDPRLETVHRYMRHVMDMPDGTARTPVDGVTIIIRPFELVAEPESNPDRVSGVYLVGPTSALAGPQILWVCYSERLAFKAYASEADLLAQLQTDTGLQDLLLSRIAPYARTTYANGGFVEPHLPRYIESSETDVLLKPAAPVLASRPILGNLFKELYADNLRLLLEMAAVQSKSTQQADWESFKYMLSLVAETALMFLPARLSIPLVVWQSLGALRAGVDAARKGEWGEAVGDFALALGMSATSRPPSPVPGEVTPRREVPLEGATLPVQLTPQQHAGLQPFEVNDVALVDLQINPDTHLYSDRFSGFTYAALGGQVFRLQQWRDRWRIHIGEEREGPLVKLNEHRQWMLDPQEPLLGGGPVFSRTILGAYTFTHEINAIGMDSIKRRFPDKALKIREAHELASRYLEQSRNVLHTLNQRGAANAANRSLLREFFGVDQFDEAMLARIIQLIDPMHARFLHPDMSPQTSSKYVVCRSRYTDNAVAFVNIADPGKLMYLTDDFFNSFFEQAYALNNRYLKHSATSFAVSQHYRASFLLHETSHQILGTDDILYMNPGFPYADLLDGQTFYGGFLKHHSERLQLSYSPHGPQEHLFQNFSSLTQQWTDIPRGPAKSHVKKIAGVQTLEQARGVFKDDPMKRIDLMMANADTVTLLILKLGRIYPKHPGR